MSRYNGAARAWSSGPESPVPGPGESEGWIVSIRTIELLTIRGVERPGKRSFSSFPRGILHRRYALLSPGSLLLAFAISCDKFFFSLGVQRRYVKERAPYLIISATKLLAG